MELSKKIVFMIALGVSAPVGASGPVRMPIADTNSVEADCGFASSVLVYRNVALGGQTQPAGEIVSIRVTSRLDGVDGAARMVDVPRLQGPPIARIISTEAQCVNDTHMTFRLRVSRLGQNSAQIIRLLVLPVGEAGLFQD